MFKDKINISAFILTLLSVPLGHVFTIEFQASIVWPSLGIVFAFVIIYKTKVYVPLFTGLFIGYLFSNLVIMDYAFHTALFNSLLLTVSTFFAVSVGRHFIEWFNLEAKVNKKTLIVFLFTVIIVVSLTASFGSLILVLLGTIKFNEYFSAFYVWALGDAFSMIIFGTTIAIALKFDSCLIPNLKSNIAKHEMLFYSLLLFFALLLFDERIPFINYESHKFLFFPFAIYATYHFPHRSYYIGALMFLGAMAIYPPYYLEGVSYFYFLFDVNLFLIFVAILFFSLKLLFIRLDREINAMETTKTRREGLVESMDTLFTLSSDMISADSLETEDQAIKTFRIIYNLFSGIDYGACMIIQDGKITWIDTIGFDKHLLNSLKSNAFDFKGGLDKPILIKNAEKWIEKDFGDNYTLYKKHNPPIKESVLMSVKISDEFTCEMSFDIAQESESSFSQEIMEYFDSLNILLNGFYESQLISFKHDEKKSAMVLSLLKTIELFDKHTYEHSFDVANLTKDIAKAFSYNHETINRLYWAGIVHDIGKIGIPKDIVNKPDALTITEYETIKDHVHHAYSMLNKSDSLQMIASYVKHHHERYDGSGYPDGIEGDNLPFENYILNIAEVIATLAREQSYAKQFTQREILDVLRKYRGIHWPERLVDIVLQMIHNGLLENYYTK